MNDHGLCSRPLCLAVVNSHLWYIRDHAKDLARSWQGLGLSGWLKQLEALLGGLEEDLGGDLGRFGNIWRPLGGALGRVRDAEDALSNILETS